MNSERPFADGRRTAVFVFNALRVDAGRLTRSWLARLRAFEQQGWATHAVLINRDAHLERTIGALVAAGRMPADTAVHHYPARDRRIRPTWFGPLPEGRTTDDRVADWLDWLTAQVPGAVVVADSPAAYPYLARMSNPLVARVGAIHLNHLSGPDGSTDDPALGAMAARFAERFEAYQRDFDALVVMTERQADDLRRRSGPDLPVVVIPPAVPRPADPPVVARPPHPRRIVSVGPLEPAARHGDAVRALAATGAEHPDVVLQIVGEGDQAGALHALAGDLGVADRVLIGDPGPDHDAPFSGATLTVWTGRRESCPLSIVRSLSHGVPVVARDERYGPAELLTSPELGDLAADAEALTTSVRRRLAESHDPVRVRAAAEHLLQRTDPEGVARRWVSLATELADRVCDHRSPSLLVDSVSTTSRVLRAPGILADSATELASWSCRLPGLLEPAGWLVEPTPSVGSEPTDPDEPPPSHPHAAGPTHEVAVQLRSNALAYVVTGTGEPVRLEFGDGTSTAPLLSTGFDDRVIASQAGTATLRRHADGTVWVHPRPGLLRASDVDGRLLVRLAPDQPASDITHAVDWVVDIDWADMNATPEGVAFTGTLRAEWIAPADDSPPAICVTDVGGYSRPVGQLHFTGEPVAEDLAWSVAVAGVIETDPLVATTSLARRALALHVGYRGMLEQVGGLWTHGHRSPLLLTCSRGTVTLLPSPGGRVLAAPGRGLRARTSGTLRGLLSRG